MKRLEAFIAFVKGFGLLFGFYIERRFEYVLGDKTPKSLLVIVAFLSLLASIKIFERLAETSIERWRWLRKSILGDNYIEGVWFNKVPTNPPLYGLLRIELRDGSVGVEGEQYDQDATLTATWHSEMAHFDGSILTYAYRVIYVREGQSHEIQGISRISFAKVSQKGVPRSYNGHFQDIAVEQKNFCFTGFLLEDQQILAKIERPDGKHEAITALVTKLNQS
jgi:hypothetical protein